MVSVLSHTRHRTAAPDAFQSLLIQSPDTIGLRALEPCCGHRRAWSREKLDEQPRSRSGDPMEFDVHGIERSFPIRTALPKQDEHMQAIAGPDAQDRRAGVLNA